jgi:hypothetical protein
MKGRADMKIRQLTILLLVSAGCLHSPQAVEEPGEFTAGFINIFERYEGKCPYFAHKDIDWGERGYLYYPLAGECSTESELIEILTDMLAELQDPAISITRYDDEGEPVEVIYPFTTEYESNYDMDVLVEYYLEPNGWAGWEDGYEQGFGWCDPSVLPYFFLDTLPTSVNTETALDSLDVFVASCIELDVPAVIIDVRMNPFGFSENMYGSSGVSLIGRFTEKFRPGAIYRSRSGPAYDMYEDRRPAVSAAGSHQYTGTVVVLVGENCTGWSENMLANFINFPNVILVGDTTGGSVSSCGSVYFTDYCKCGYVKRTILTYDKFWIEGAGLPPDIFVEATQADFAAGIDPVLDYAIGMLE